VAGLFLIMSQMISRSTPKYSWMSMSLKPAMFFHFVLIGTSSGVLASLDRLITSMPMALPSLSFFISMWSLISSDMYSFVGSSNHMSIESVSLK